MEEENTHKKGNTVLLTIIAVATLLVAVIGATFAYFSVTVSGNEGASSVIVKTGMLGITFTDGQEINFQDIKPGDNLSGMGKTFTIVNTGDYEIPFSIRWNVVTNNFGQREGSDAVGPFAGRSDFLYSLTGTGAGITGTNGVTDEPLMNVGRSGFSPITELTDIRIPANATRDATQTYTLTFSFENKPTPQDYDQNRSFSAVINVAVAQGFQIGD